MATDLSTQQSQNGGRGRRGGPCISLKSITVVRDGAAILSNIDWDVEPGQRWALLGPNGSGKTTLLQVAGANMIPTRGVALILGGRLGRVDMRELRTRIAFVSAAVARTLRPGIGALDAVLTGCHAALEAWWHLYTDAERQRAEDLLADAGFAGGHFAQRQFGLLSEGERQQVLLARALMSSPELILMDEPAAGLDLGAREQLLTRLAAIAADPASPAFVLVTHHLEELPVGMTHAVLLRKGSVLAAGAIDEVLTSQAVSAVFATQVVVQHLGGRWTARAIA